jgi:putative tryptophan/tyrosine transport system substrate-binding protein
MRPNHLRRRQFITLLGGTAITIWLLPARAQQASKLPTIGFLGASTAVALGRWLPAFVQRLRELGWVEGHTVVIDYRFAEGQTQRFFEIATEFAQLKVEVIVTSGQATAAAKQVTSVIPIVFAIAQDLVVVEKV